MTTLSGFKQIADYVETAMRKLGFDGISFSPGQARKWAGRLPTADPLPIEPFAGGVYCRTDKLDLWIERNLGKRQVRRKSDQSCEPGESEKQGELPI